MKRIMKRILRIILFICMFLSLTGCEEGCSEGEKNLPVKLINRSNISVEVQIVGISMQSDQSGPEISIEMEPGSRENMLVNDELFVAQVKPMNNWLAVAKQERDELEAAFEKAAGGSDKDKVQQINSDLAALDSEIASYRTSNQMKSARCVLTFGIQTSVLIVDGESPNTFIVSCIYTDIPKN